MYQQQTLFNAVVKQLSKSDFPFTLRYYKTKVVMLCVSRRQRSGDCSRKLPSL